MLDAPDAFGYQDGPEALAVVLPGASSLSDDRLAEIAGLCPVGAIHLYDDQGHEVPLTGA